jgi:hypothetical protein
MGAIHHPRQQVPRLKQTTYRKKKPMFTLLVIIGAVGAGTIAGILSWAAITILENLNG